MIKALVGQMDQLRHADLPMQSNRVCAGQSQHPMLNIMMYAPF